VQKLDDPKQANGTIRISCPKGCRLGDDKTTLKPPKAARSSAFASELHFGHLDLDRFTIAIDIKDGKGTVSAFDVVSKDIVMKLAGTFEVAKPFSASPIDLCLRFASTPALEARDAKTHALIQTTGAIRASDGLFNIRLTETFGNMKRLAVVCDGSASATVSDATPPSTEIDPDIAKLIASAVKSTSATTFEIDAATWDKLFANPAEVVKGARLVPAMRDGKPEGFKIYAIKPASLVARLGFQNGDTLVAILGEPMTSADRGLEVYTKIRNLEPGEPIDVIVMRKGTAITLTYKLK
jgi:membrane-associated protease RseP (regulator of RpoE activity)